MAAVRLAHGSAARSSCSLASAHFASTNAYRSRYAGITSAGTRYVRLKHPGRVGKFFLEPGVCRNGRDETRGRAVILRPIRQSSKHLVMPIRGWHGKCVHENFEHQLRSPLRQCPLTRPILSPIRPLRGSSKCAAIFSPCKATSNPAISPTRKPTSRRCSKTLRPCRTYSRAMPTPCNRVR